MKLSLVLLALLVFSVHTPTVQTAVDSRQIDTTNTLCVVDVTGLPIPVQFQNSITLTQALKRARILRENIKNRVFMFSTRQDNSIQLTKLDLKRIENGATDSRLDQNGIVYVEAKRKQSPADLEAIGRSCQICGCRPAPLMHGGIVLLPEQRSASNAPTEKNADPNNQKP